MCSMKLYRMTQTDLSYGQSNKSLNSTIQTVIMNNLNTVTPQNSVLYFDIFGKHRILVTKDISKKSLSQKVKRA